jgi:zinc and cadmium transporter
MSSTVLLTYYCLAVLLASIGGGMIPVWFRLSHRWMECAVSFVAGVMLGIGLLHMLPHALEQAEVSIPPNEAHWQVVVWVLAGLLVMFFIERFFCFHHHGVEDGEVTCHHGETEHDQHEHSHQRSHNYNRSHGHGHDLSWSGAALGLTLHSVIEGVALAAAVAHEGAAFRLAGFGTFLVILLHKPFDSMSIATLMAHGGWSLTWRHIINGLFSLAIPLGIAVFYFGLMSDGGGATLAKALAFAAGTFLCIALSDLLPELQFHDHDRGKLSAALLLGLALAWGISRLESTTHQHLPMIGEPSALVPGAM